MNLKTIWLEVLLIRIVAVVLHALESCSLQGQDVSCDLVEHDSSLLGWVVLLRMHVKSVCELCELVWLFPSNVIAPCSQA